MIGLIDSVGVHEVQWFAYEEGDGETNDEGPDAPVWRHNGCEDESSGC